MSEKAGNVSAKSKQYWIKRTEEREKIQQLKPSQTAAIIHKAYDTAISNIDKEVNSAVNNLGKQLLQKKKLNTRARSTPTRSRTVINARYLIFKRVRIWRSTLLCYRKKQYRKYFQNLLPGETSPRGFILIPIKIFGKLRLKRLVPSKFFAVGEKPRLKLCAKASHNFKTARPRTSRGLFWRSAALVSLVLI